jgi:hypothetical protein
MDKNVKKEELALKAGLDPEKLEGFNEEMLSEAEQEDVEGGFNFICINKTGCY